MAGSLSAAFREMLVEVREEQRAARLREVEAELAAIYASDPETCRLVDALADRLREPADFIRNGIAVACAEGRLRDEEARTQLGAPTDPDSLRDSLREAARPPRTRRRKR